MGNGLTYFSYYDIIFFIMEFLMKVGGILCVSFVY
jgi:hypothetical protein